MAGEATRPTGIPALGDVPWGTHMCQLYEGEQDMLEILIPYLAAGLASNDRSPHGQQ